MQYIESIQSLSSTWSSGDYIAIDPCTASTAGPMLLPALLTAVAHGHNPQPPPGCHPHAATPQPITTTTLSPTTTQIHRQFRKPLIIASPKSLLRHPKCKSPLSEFDDVPDDAGIVGVRFKRVIMDDAGLMPKNRGPNPPKVRGRGVQGQGVLRGLLLYAQLQCMSWYCVLGPCGHVLQAEGGGQVCQGPRCAVHALQRAAPAACRAPMPSSAGILHQHMQEVSTPRP